MSKGSFHRCGTEIMSSGIWYMAADFRKCITFLECNNDSVYFPQIGSRSFLPSRMMACVGDAVLLKLSRVFMCSHVHNTFGIILTTSAAVCG